MGYLYYAAEPLPAELPDRVLAHVKVIVATKLRRGESFMLSWKQPADEAPGLTSIWIQPSIPLRFVFDSPEHEELDSGYLTELAHAAQSTRGLVLDLDEQVRPAAAVAA